MRYDMLIAASQASMCRGVTLLVLRWLKYRGKLQAVHWRAAARGLSAIENVKRYIFSRQLSEGHISVVAKCRSFVYNIQTQSKKQLKSTFFFFKKKKNLFQKCLLTCRIKRVRPVFDFLFLKTVIIFISN